MNKNKMNEGSSMQLETFLQQHHVSLNEQQKEAVLNQKGKILLLAVPGSGKTTVMVTRIAYWLAQNQMRPEQILTLTYSVSSARDMKRKYESLFGPNEKLEFRTIHSFCVKVLQEWERQTGKKVFPLLKQTGPVLAKIYVQLTHTLPSEILVNELQNKIAFVHNGMLTRKESEQLFAEYLCGAKIVQAYQQYKRRNRVMDFDDQLLYAKKILEKYPSILQKMQHQYPYLYVDEAQDISKIQHVLIQQLVRDHLFMVGDEDQSIYGFRSADPATLFHFQQIYPGAQILYMEKNYRSTPQILQVAHQFMQQNKNRHDKKIHSTRQTGEKVKIVVLKNYETQYQYLYQHLKQETRRTAILYRNNESAIPLIDLFSQKGLAFQMKACERNWVKHPMVQTVQNFIRYAWQENDPALFEKIYSKMGCGITKEIVKKAISRRNLEEPILDTIMKQKEMLFWQIKRIQQIKKWMMQWKQQETETVLRCILHELIETQTSQPKKGERPKESTKINTLKILAKQNPNPPNFLKAIVSIEQQMKQGVQNDSPLYLMTMHASKGLEFEQVILMDVLPGILPSMTKAEIRGTEEQLQHEEEVRLFYVAMTRARDKLVVLQYQNQGGKALKSSEFIQKISQTNEKPKDYSKGSSTCLAEYFL